MLAGSQIIQLYYLVNPRRQVQICECMCACTLNVCVHVYVGVCVRCLCVHVLQPPWVTKGLLINHSIHCLWIHRAGQKTVPLCLFHTHSWLMLCICPTNNNTTCVCLTSLTVEV